MTDYKLTYSDDEATAIDRYYRDKGREAVRIRAEIVRAEGELAAALDRLARLRRELEDAENVGD